MYFNCLNLYKEKAKVSKYSHDCGVCLDDIDNTQIYGESYSSPP